MRLPNSRLIVATAAHAPGYTAAQANTRKAYAEQGCEYSQRALRLHPPALREKPQNMARLDTTASLAIMPVSSATAACQQPYPIGLNTGAMKAAQPAQYARFRALHHAEGQVKALKEPQYNAHSEY